MLLLPRIGEWLLQLVIGFYKRSINPCCTLLNDLLAPIQDIPLLKHTNNMPLNQLTFTINRDSNSNLIRHKNFFSKVKQDSVQLYGIEESKLEKYLTQQHLDQKLLLQLFNKYYESDTSVKKEEFDENVMVNSITKNISQALLQEYRVSGGNGNPFIVTEDVDIRKEETNLNRSLFKLNKFLLECQQESDPAFKSMLKLTEYTQKTLEKFQQFRLGMDEVAVVFLGRTGVGKSFLCNLILYNIFPQQYTKIFKDNLYSVILDSHPLIEDVSLIDPIVFNEDFISSTSTSPYFEEFYNQGAYQVEVERDKAFEKVVKDFYKKGTLDEDQKKALSYGAFLFPSKAHLNSTTSFPILIKGGVVPALHIVFFTPEEYNSIQDIIMIPKSAFPTKSYHHYFAKGEDLYMDRLYMKFLIKKYFDDPILCPLIKEMTVYVPVEILVENRIKFIDAPGSNDSSPLHKFQ